MMTNSRKCTSLCRRPLCRRRCCPSPPDLRCVYYRCWRSNKCGAEETVWGESLRKGLQRTRGDSQRPQLREDDKHELDEGGWVVVEWMDGFWAGVLGEPQLVTGLCALLTALHCLLMYPCLALPLMNSCCQSAEKFLASVVYSSFELLGMQWWLDCWRRSLKVVVWRWSMVALHR